MREVRISVPLGQGKRIVEMALKIGASSASITPILQFPDGQKREQISIETSTPTAREIIDDLLFECDIDPTTVSITSRELRAVVSRDRRSKITNPLREPEIDVLEQLWQYSYITVSLVTRGLVSSLLLTYGMIKNLPLVMASALLFTPFLSQLLAVSFGTYQKDWKLFRLGLSSLALSTFITFVSGIFLGIFLHEPMMFTDFGSLSSNFLISMGIAIAAGIATLDDIGWRQFLGFAIGSQYAKFPVWFGYTIAQGTIDWSLLFTRFSYFILNALTICIFSLGTYFVFRMRRNLGKILR